MGTRALTTKNCVRTLNDFFEDGTKRAHLRSVDGTKRAHLRSVDGTNRAHQSGPPIGPTNRAHQSGHRMPGTIDAQLGLRGILAAPNRAKRAMIDLNTRPGDA